MAGMAVVAEMMSCHSGSDKNNKNTAQADSIIVAAQPAKLTHTAGTMDMIRDMYENERYEDYEYLRSHCTEHLLKQLEDAYSNEYGEGGLAVWLFRSGAQDGPNRKHSIISIERLSDGWYRYKGVDMGVEFVREIRLVKEGEEYKFDQINVF